MLMEIFYNNLSLWLWTDASASWLCHVLLYQYLTICFFCWCKKQFVQCSLSVRSFWLSLANDICFILHGASCFAVLERSIALSSEVSIAWFLSCVFLWDSTGLAKTDSMEWSPLKLSVVISSMSGLCVMSTDFLCIPGNNTKAKILWSSLYM